MNGMRRALGVFTAAVAAAAAVLSFGPTTAARPAPSSRPWMAPGQTPDRRADELIARMTLDEKIALLHGVTKTGYIGYVPAIPRLGIPPLALTDGPLGVRIGRATQLPAGVSVAASFDRKTARTYGDVLGSEAVAKGQNVLLGPNVNMVRVPMNGRSFEGLGEDPYLASALVVPEIRAVQQHHVVTTIKHYVGNDQETNRSLVDALINQRTLHEIELPAFRAAVKQGHSGGVMCAYNKVNGPWMCENKPLLTQVLRKQWGFRGFVVSDWGGTHSTASAAKSGLDLEMPDDTYFGPALKTAVENGDVPVGVVDRMVHRILRTMFAYGLFDHPIHTGHLPVRADAVRARKVAESGAVLLKNNRSQLPLSAAKHQRIAVIGADADTALTGGGGSARVLPVDPVTPLSAIRSAAPHASVRFAQGNDPVAPGSDIPGLQPVPSATLTPSVGGRGLHGLTGTYYLNRTFSGSPRIVRPDPGVYFNWHWYDMPNFAASAQPPMPPASAQPQPVSVRWTGTFSAPRTGKYTFELASTNSSKLYWDGKVVIDNSGQHPLKRKRVTMHLVKGQRHRVQIDYVDVIDFDATLNGARIKFGWTPPAGTVDRRIAAAARLAKASDVAVVFARDYETEAVDRPNLKLPNSQNQLISAVAAANPHTIVVLETGSAVTMPWIRKVPSVLEAWYPGERGGQAIARLLFGAVDPQGRLPITFPRSMRQLPTSSPIQYPGVKLTERYSERLDVGYRHYDAARLRPLFPFGHGLSYTTFSQALRKTYTDRSGTVHLAVKVTNTGSRRGTDVIQAYVGFPASVGEPPKQLKAFGKVSLRPGRSEVVRLRLAPAAFSYWNTTSRSWQVKAGVYRVMAATSSRDVFAAFTVKQTGRDLGP